ncbi:PsiF family protein [Comamonas composti]|uniref:PsiF family protein n=1 Tax=Comamonas composti TaxID=408558 RepID=UPI00047A7AF1|nr:PsiF family protein [Comamonas composti]
MKKLIVLAAASLACSMAFAAEGQKEGKAPTAQQKLMGTCNTEATGKKGDERKEFMKACLSDGKKRQQERMKSCNAEATGKKGDERKAFMSECLRKN